MKDDVDGSAMADEIGDEIGDDAEAELRGHESAWTEAPPREVKTAALVQSRAMAMEAQIAELEKAALFAALIREETLKVTNERDWVNQGGNPYLCSTGMEKVARLAALWWDVEEKIRTNGEDEHGPYYAWTVTGRVGVKDDKVILTDARGNQSIGYIGGITAVGVCESRDPFLGTRSVEKKDSAGNVTYERVFLPLHEVPEHRILKKALTNFIVRGVGAFLGLRTFTWDQLAKAGIDVEFIRGERSVRYRGDEQERQTHKRGKKKVEWNEQQRAKIKEMDEWLSQMVGGDAKAAGDLFQKGTSFTGSDGKQIKGKRTPAELTSAKWLDRAYASLKTEHEAWCGDNDIPFEAI